MKKASSTTAISGATSSAQTSESGSCYKNCNFPPSKFGNAALCNTIRLGGRKAQEDRCILVPRACGEEGCMFLGVYDGTVGDGASEFLSHRLADAVCTSPHFQRALAARAARAPLPPGCLEAALVEGFRATDEALLQTMAEALTHAPPPQASALERMEREKELAYCASTTVAALLVGGTLCVAHVGDSRAALGRRRVPEGSAASGGASVLEAAFLTLDHKPNSPAEAARIQGLGGAIVYLHGGKPFLRGGDFSAAQQAGKKPMQLNYSRAFGGLRLKPYGLSAVPDVTCVELSASEHTIVILGSDGLWDIFADPAEAVKKAWEAHCNGWDASALLADAALAGHEARGTEDNVTCTVLILAPAAVGAGGAGGAAGGSTVSAASGSTSTSAGNP